MDYAAFERRLRWLARPDAPKLIGGLQGVEKESLRVDATGHLAQTPHPKALGSKLTHPAITTDYSESLLEFITPPQIGADTTLNTLRDIHAITYDALDPEYLWATSMPCAVGADASIPIADYGTSNSGMMKHIYRRGLGWRYGRTMQTISGVHFNYSLPLDFWPVWQAYEGRDEQDLQTFISEAYFDLTRNFQRLGWIVPYLFGASPALCASFLHGAPHDFKTLGTHTLYEPFATSLRMSDIGYKNKNQAHLHICHNSLEAYVAGLTEAIFTPEPDYERIGLKVDGQYRQLNTHVLQIENEYYSFIRPKNVAQSGERPTLALKRRGVKYIEVRALDVNIFEPCGVNREQLLFIEAFLIYCLLEDSPPIHPDENAAINRNQARVARCGRQPDLKLERAGEFCHLREWGHEILDKISPIAALLDEQSGGQAYSRVLARQRESMHNSDNTPSAQILTTLRDNNESFFSFSKRTSERHRDHFAAQTVAADTRTRFVKQAQKSLREQEKIEAADTISFEAFVQHYFDQH